MSATPLGRHLEPGDILMLAVALGALRAPGRGAAPHWELLRHPDQHAVSFWRRSTHER